MKLINTGHSFHYEMERLTIMFFPGESVQVDRPVEPGEDLVETVLSREGEIAHLLVRCFRQGQWLQRGEDVPLTGVPDEEKELERRMAVLLYRLLEEVTGIHPAWGILTGIRPIKLFRSLLDRGMTLEQVQERFRQDLLVDESRVRLATWTEGNESKILNLSTPKSYSLYVSIPFCPSRCRYCSFVSHSIEKAKKLMPEYVNKLCQELRVTGQIARDLGLRLETVYFGGGTPTTLDEEQLRQVTGELAQAFDLSQIREYTIEAGRPDTLNREKFRIMKQAGVTRISINPQTLNDSVLQAIGRRHTAQETIDSFRLAREEGMDNINMDLIAGLPTDTLESFQRTIEGVLALGPENVTVHTLSVKRSSHMGQEGAKAYETMCLVDGMVAYAQKRLTQEGYEPYYLYRQKNTMDNLENTGFCKPGYPGYYNVYIMDETHSIFSVGAGGVTKLRDPVTDQIQRIFNYKYPYEYISRYDQILDRKEQVRTFYEQHWGSFSE